MQENKDTIIFSGGGTGGSIVPLLAVAEELMENKPNLNYLFVGTKSGPEQELLKTSYLPQSFKFIALPAGKWRRYFSFKHFFDIFIIIYAFFLSLIYLYRYQPKAIFSAGAFVSVPLVWAAFFFKIPVLIHQQDIRPGLANLLMAKVARVVGVTFKESAKKFGKKALAIGNPIRTKTIKELELKKDEYYKKWNFKKNLPLLIVIGGGTGSLALNKLILETWPFIKGRWQVVHITGKLREASAPKDEDYRSFKFLPNKDLINLMLKADLIISRAGLGILTEMSALGSAAIIIPMPNSHQEDNAEILEKKQAAWVIKQKDLKVEDLVDKLNNFCNNKEFAKIKKRNMKDLITSGAEKKLANILESWLYEN